MSTQQNSTKFFDLELSKIIPDPNQPRRTFDEMAQDELTNSIREKGVIQPILVRPYGDGYMVVAGERRYRSALSVAAAFKQRNTIPAIIRDLSDDEALEIQITENLLRKDPHPLEEAIAFAKLHERLTIEQISNRVGKSASFVAKRIRLADLCEDGQKIYFNGHMDLEQAMMLSRLDPEFQAEIIEEECPGDWRKRLGKDWEVGNIAWYINKGSNDLSKARFNLDDASLYPEAGACNLCPHNSANQPLLFDDLKGQICGKPSCFGIKHQRQYKKSLEALASDPKAIAISGYVYSDEDKGKLAAAKEMGINVIDYNDWIHANDPDQFFPDFDEWVLDEYGEDWRDDEGLDEKELRSEYNERKKDWETEVEEFNAGVAEGRVIKALCIVGNSEGKELYVEIKQNAMARVNAVTNAASGEEAAVNAEIASLEAKEVRNKQLDGEKIWAGVRQLITTDEARLRIYDNNAELLREERKALFLAMADKLDYSTKRLVREIFGEDYQDLQLITEGMLMQMSRVFLLDVMATGYGSHLTKGSKNSYAFPIIKHYFFEDVTKIELAQTEKAEARIERLQKRIAALRATLDKKEEEQRPNEAEHPPVSITGKQFERVGKKFALNNSYFKNARQNWPSTPYEVFDYFIQHRDAPFSCNENLLQSEHLHILFYETFIEYQKRAGVHFNQFFTPVDTAARIAQLGDFYFSKDDVVLDACCGFGMLSAELVNAGFKVEGFDGYPDFAQMYKRITGGEFTYSGIEEYKPREGGFSAIVSNPPYEVNTCAEFLEKLLTWLSPDGKAILLLPKGFMHKERPKALVTTIKKFEILHREDMGHSFDRTNVRAEIVVVKKAD